jgi:hypothetical protein
VRDLHSALEDIPGPFVTEVVLETDICHKPPKPGRQQFENPLANGSVGRPGPLFERGDDLQRSAGIGKLSRLHVREGSLFGVGVLSLTRSNLAAR